MYTLITLNGVNTTIHTKDNFKNVLFDSRSKDKFESFPPRIRSSIVIFNDQPDYVITQEVKEIKEIDTNTYYIKTNDSNYIIKKNGK